MSGFWEPFEFAFFRNGLAVAVIAGALCGLVGAFVVVRGMSYLGHGLSHAVFGGAALGATAGIGYYPAAGAWGIGAALLIGRISGRRVIHSDAAIGVVSTASFAIGVVALALWGQASRGIEAVLFGSILGVGRADLAIVAAIAIGIAVAIALRYRALVFTSFDPEVAGAAGVPVARIDALLMVLLALAVLGTMQVIGAVLVSAAIVIPAATARLLTDSFGRMLVISTALGAAAGLVGMVASYHLDVPSGATITLVAALGFAVAGAARALRG
ncbi:metal ABC transporter permease [Aquihabitans sp. McL0605]|uniref:metal ABC transporter permease n=1 Tax=Aquihabitans sp. McL0605 TaxID=3415671 RepID=UPI003CF843E3